VRGDIFIDTLTFAFSNPEVTIEGKYPCGQVDLLKELDS
jgi:hypothetical protein